MLYILVALFCFLEAVFIHLVICRQTSKEGLFLKAFFVIAAVNLGICWIIFTALARFTPQDSNVFFLPLQWTSTVLYILLIPSYLVFYFSTQQMSPSKKIMLLLMEKDGMSLSELLVHFRDEEFIAPRVHDLLLTQCMREANGRYVLTPQGCSMARVYALYQWILGRKKGG